jgi:hypothetical protein
VVKTTKYLIKRRKFLMKLKKILAFLVVSALALSLAAIPASASNLSIDLVLYAIGIENHAAAANLGTPVTVDKDGEYTLSLTTSSPHFAWLQISNAAIRWNADIYNIAAGTEIAALPAGWSNVSIDITGVTINGTEVGLKNNTGLPIRDPGEEFAPNRGRMVLWQAWYEPHIRLDIAPDFAHWGTGSALLNMGTTPNTTVVTFRVRGLGGGTDEPEPPDGPVEPPTPPTPPSADDRFTTAAALSILRVAVGLDTATDEMLKIYDFDGTGELTPATALQILRIAVGLDPVPCDDDDCEDDH